MQQAHKFLPKAFFDNSFVDFEKAKISIATHALQYGTGAFGGLRVQKQNNGKYQVFRLDEHAKRLSQSARFLNFKISSDFISEKIQEFIRINKPDQSAYIRPLVYISELGIAPKLHDMEKSFLIYGLELGDYLPTDGVTCCFSSWQRQVDVSFPLRGKITGAYITSSLAKTEAVHRGFDEAILLNSLGKICEGSAMNIFVVRDNLLFTPSLDQDILEGITRKSIIEIAQDLGVKVIQRPVDKTELLIADEAFLTGSAAKITPIKSIENYKLPEDRPLTNQLKKVMNQILDGNNSQSSPSSPSSQYSKWVQLIS